MTYAFICDDTQSFKPFTAANYEAAVSFMLDRLSEAREVRIATVSNVPDGYVEAA